MARISVIYHHFPHYRAPVMRALARSVRHSYRFFGSVDDYQGISAFRGDREVRIEAIEFVRRRGDLSLDIAGFERAVSREFDATIIIGNPNMRGTWAALTQARRNGLAVAYWAHGWLRPEPWYKARLRNFYFGRADVVLTYGARAIELARRSGFPAERIRPIWNSLDWEAQSALFKALEYVPVDELRREIGMPAGVPVIATISRVTELCRYEWLVEAVARLRADRAIPAEIWMIGEGPALPALRERAASLGVPLHLQGALYDEEQIARHIMAADLVASPGKVGLTAMHALAYGTPVVTHADLDRQMPEVEAIMEGQSGALFRFGDVDDLAAAIERLLDGRSDVAARRAACRAALAGRFTPQDQARIIDDAMTEITDGRTRP